MKQHARFLTLLVGMGGLFVGIKATTVHNSSRNKIDIYFGSINCRNSVDTYFGICQVYRKVAPGESVSYPWKSSQKRPFIQIVEENKRVETRGELSDMYTWTGFDVLEKRIWDVKKARYGKRMTVQPKNKNFILIKGGMF